MAQPDEVRGNHGHREPASSSPISETPASNDRSSSRPRYVAPFFPSGTQPEIIRASQKDLFYLGQLTDQLQEVLRGIFGTRWLQAYIEEIGVASGLAYYGLTTLLGSQTLGEEYVDILQYSERTRKIPTLRSRIALISSHVLAPYALAKAYVRVKRFLADRRAAAAASVQAQDPDSHILNEQEPLFADSGVEDQHPVHSVATSSSPIGRLPLLSLLTTVELPSFETLIDEHLRAIHLAIFYLFGRYYNLSKRILRIRYLSLQNKTGPGAQRPPSYEVLGVLMAVQLSVRLLSVLYKRRKAKQELQHQARIKAGEEIIEEKVVPKIDNVPVTDLTFDPEADDDDEELEEEDDDTAGVRKCTLCLSPRKDPACTECGHIFCFTCIVGWAREKAECPLCRQKVNLSRILPLYNV